MRRLALLAAVGGVCGFLLALGLANVPAQAASPDCVACHNQPVTVTFPNGDKITGTVNVRTYDASVHARLPCSACHAEITGYPHPKLTAASAKEWRTGLKDSCKTCHAAVFTEMNGSAHAMTLAATISCLDCHDAHAANTAHPSIVPAGFSCSTCHADISKSYMDSVHAKTADHGESDAPYCTTCHKAHQFNVKPTRAESVAVCIGCHSNEELMAKYGVSSTVVSTYLHDFHGKTAVLEGKENTTVDAAVCTDCHGVHAIKPIDSANSLTTLSGTSQVCQQCHPGKQESFASAFLRHSTPSPTKDVLIFIVDWFYRLMIPFVLIGLGIHIAFDVRQARKQKKGAHHGGSS